MQKAAFFLVFSCICSIFFYSPREECIFAQTLLLQLLQSCFSVLTGDNKTAKPQETPQSKTAGHTEAAEELYRHLCEGNFYSIYIDCFVLLKFGKRFLEAKSAPVPLFLLQVSVC